MVAKILEIEERIGGGGVADPPKWSYFAYREAQEISLETILHNPNLSIYGLDDENRQVIFVSTPPEIDLTHGAFISLIQFEKAQHLVVMSYEDFFQLTSHIPSPNSLIFINTVGRSGSTLLTKAFNALDSVVSYSEPAFITNCLSFREADGSRDEELIELIRSCVRFFCNPVDQKTTYVIKWHSWGIHLGDLIQEAFPQAKNIFLYRHAETWANSWHRLYKQFGVDFDDPSNLSGLGDEKSVRRILPLFTTFTDGFGKARMVDAITIFWLSPMDKYLKLYQQQSNNPYIAIRFEDLIAHREQTLTAIFDHGDLPTSQLEHVLKVYEEDSQVGTPLEGTSQQEGDTQFSITEGQLKRLNAILQKHDVIKTPDFRLPGTLEIED